MRLLAHNRRVNLDMFWSREPATVRNQITSYNKSVGCDLSHGLVPSFLVKGPWGISDDVRFVVALQMVTASNLKERYYDSYQQYDTVRKMRSFFSNMYESSW